MRTLLGAILVAALVTPAWAHPQPSLDLARSQRASTSTELDRKVADPAVATVGVEQRLAGKPDAATRLCAVLATDPNAVGDDSARQIPMAGDGCTVAPAPVAGQPVETTPPVAPSANAERF